MTDEQIINEFMFGDATKLTGRDRKRLNELLEEALRDPDEDYSKWEE